LADNAPLSSVSLYKLVPVWDRPGRDRMVVGFITTCAISAYDP